MDEGVHVVDENGITVFYNQTMATLEGTEPKKVINKSLLEVFPFFCRETSTLMKVLKTGKPINEQRQVYMNLKGIKITTINSTFPIKDKGEIIGAVEISKDITNIEEMSGKIIDLQEKIYHKKDKNYSTPSAKYTFSDIIGESNEIKEVISYAKKASMTSSSVLIFGETGTGKELFAQSIHNASARREGPFVAVNCAALPASLLESELFGYVGGAFTGAKRKGKAGLFELAHTGTIFLDEIGEMPLELQARLLRVLEEREVVRLGSERVTPVNIRVIAATNRDLKEAVDKGKFRADLYYRLNVLPLRVPSLDERRSDIPLLFRYFVAKIAEHLGQETPVISAPALELICSRSYPGNVRELKNLAERLTVLARDGVISPASVGQMPIKEERHEIENTPQQPKCKGGDVIEVPVNTLKKMESRMVQEVLKKFHGDRQKTANVLGVSRTTVWRKVRQANGG